MKTAKKSKKQAAGGACREQIVFRVPADLKKFYAGLATADKRTLSDTLRIALEDRANQLREQQAA